MMVLKDLQQKQIVSLQNGDFAEGGNLLAFQVYHPLPELI